MNKEKFNFVVPAKGENLSMVRLTTSAIASKSNFSIDKIEDLKLCISEICNIIIKGEASDVFNIEYFLGDDEIEVSLLDLSKPKKEMGDIEMSQMIIKALIEDITFSQESIKIRLTV